MKRFMTIGLVLAAAAGVHASQTDKAAAVLAEARTAIGAQALQNLKTLSVDASVERNVGQMQLDSDITLLMELPDKYARSETITRGPARSTSTSGFNGDTPIERFNAPPSPGGMVFLRMGGPRGPVGPDGKPVPMTPEQQAAANKAAVRSTKADLSRLMLGWFAMPFPSIDATYSYAGEAVSPDGKADVIDVKGADGFVARLFLDRETHLPLMVTYTAPKPRIVTIARGAGDGRGTESAKTSAGALQKQATDAASQPPEMADYALYFDDWRDAGGVKFPYAIKRAMSGTTVEEWTVKKIKVNPAIDAKAFDVEGS